MTHHWSADHWAAVVTTVVLAVVFVIAGRKGVGERGIRIGLALAILLSQLLDPWVDHMRGNLNLRESLPLELCDAASVAAIVALWNLNRFAFDLTYYWGLVGTMQGILTPRLDVGFPGLEYFRYWTLHSGIVLAAVYLGAGLGMAPRRFAVWRCWGAAIALAVPVGVVDWALGANYMFLRHKPAYSVLNHAGPWPWYVGSMIGMLLIGMLLLWLVYLVLRTVAPRPAPG